jgi:hypothetical protein
MTIGAGGGNRRTLLIENKLCLSRQRTAQMEFRGGTYRAMARTWSFGIAPYLPKSHCAQLS